MKIDQVIGNFRKIVIDEDLSDYKHLLETTKSSDDKYWKGILPIYQNLTPSQKEDFLLFIRLIQSNTLSHILGILDGSSTLSEEQVEFKLTTEPGGEILTGEMQNIFLEMEEEEENS